ncbi:hypothetical protein BU14_2328s0001, partial [Porphyra umbilicalis]
RHARKADDPPLRDRLAVRAGTAVARDGLGPTRGADRHGRPAQRDWLGEGPAHVRTVVNRAEVAGSGAPPRPAATDVAIRLRPAAGAVHHPIPAPDAPPRRAALHLVGRVTHDADAGARVAPPAGDGAPPRRTAVGAHGPSARCGRRVCTLPVGGAGSATGGDPADAPTHLPVAREGRRARVNARAAVVRLAEADRTDAHPLDAPVADAAPCARRVAAATPAAAAAATARAEGHGRRHTPAARRRAFEARHARGAGAMVTALPRPRRRRATGASDACQRRQARRVVRPVIDATAGARGGGGGAAHARVAAPAADAAGRARRTAGSPPPNKRRGAAHVADTLVANADRCRRRRRRRACAPPHAHAADAKVDAAPDAVAPVERAPVAGGSAPLKRLARCAGAQTPRRRRRQALQVATRRRLRCVAGGAHDGCLAGAPPTRHAAAGGRADGPARAVDAGPAAAGKAADVGGATRAPGARRDDA